MSLPLDGTLVLDLTRLLPGPLCSMWLADFGAEVIKIEQPGRGDYTRWMPPLRGDTSGLFLLLNRNKKSVTLDLKQPQGREVFLRLVREADILLEGFRPGVMERLGLGYRQLSEINPRLVYCAITGFGQDGPYVRAAGHDINYIGLAGILGQTGTSGTEGAPVLPAVQIADIGGGALPALAGILLALLARQRSGRGQLVDVAMLDGVVSWLPVLLWPLVAGQKQAPGRGEGQLNGGLACYNVYRCRDGSFLAVGALEPQFWREVCCCLQREDLVPLQFAWDKQDWLKKTLQGIFIEQDRSYWLELFQGRDACVTPVYDLTEVAADPQVQHRGLLWHLEHPRLGSLLQPGLPLHMPGVELKSAQPPPDLGQHTDEVLARFGYTRSEIADLRRNAVV